MVTKAVIRRTNSVARSCITNSKRRASCRVRTSATLFLPDFSLPPQLDEICALLGYYAAYSANSLPTFRDRNPRIELMTLKSADLDILLAYGFNLNANSKYLQISYAVNLYCKFAWAVS